MSAHDPRTWPVELDLDRLRHLRIRWADGLERAIALRDLRRACPCAACRAEREELRSKPLPLLRTGTAPGDERAITAQSAELAGTYALRITWSDGHSTGIYDFAMLRELCEQAGAVAAREEPLRVNPGGPAT